MKSSKEEEEELAFTLPTRISLCPAASAFPSQSSCASASFVPGIPSTGRRDDHKETKECRTEKKIYIYREWSGVRTKRNNREKHFSPTSVNKPPLPQKMNDATDRKARKNDNLFFLLQMKQ